MGSWDLGPFDNDMAADWSDELDEAPAEDRAELIRQALARVIDEGGLVDSAEGSEAVAAAAVVAAHQPGALAVDTAYAPGFLVAGEFLELPADLVPLAVQALSRVTGEESELREAHEEADALAEWLATIAEVRAELDA